MGIETIVGLALAAAGTGMQMSAAARSRKDMNRAVSHQIKRQGQFSAQAKPIFEGRLADAGAPEKLLSEGARASERGFSQANLLPLGSALPVDEARLQGKVRQTTDAASRLRGYDHQAFNQWLRNQEAGRNLGVIANMSQASAGNSPTLVQLAGQNSAARAGIGSLLSTAGSLAALYGAMTPATAGAGGSMVGTVDAPQGFGLNMKGVV